MTEPGTVLITGPTRGLGRAAALAMASRPRGERPDLLLVGRAGPDLTEVADEARAARRDRPRDRLRPVPAGRRAGRGGHRARAARRRRRCGRCARWSPTPAPCRPTPGGLRRRLRADLRRQLPRPRAAHRRPARLAHRPGAHRAARLEHLPRQLLAAAAARARGRVARPASSSPGPPPASRTRA